MERRPKLQKLNITDSEILTQEVAWVIVSRRAVLYSTQLSHPPRPSDFGLVVFMPEGLFVLVFSKQCFETCLMRACVLTLFKLSYSRKQNGQTVKNVLPSNNTNESANLLIYLPFIPLLPLRVASHLEWHLDGFV